MNTNTLTHSIALRVDVPIACFRQSHSREYAQTYTVPPPSTVYGMLLSLVGELKRDRHIGTRLAIGMLSEPQVSTVIRTFRRLKKPDIAARVNARPDYQELLTDIQFVVWVDGRGEQAQADNLSLPERISQAFANPSSVNRFGALCLGESRDLVNEVRLLLPTDSAKTAQWLVKTDQGLLSLPVWVDHVGSRGTRWQRFSLQNHYCSEPPNHAWVEISK
jgi:CRISPR-associated protein Cas5t